MSKTSTRASKTKSVRPLRRFEITRDDFIDRRQGAWLGQAIGDALGSTYEFTFPKSLRTDRKLDLIGGGSIGWAPGDITDDTEMALDIAKMYLDAGGYSRQHLIDHHLAWREAGPRDIGIWTSQTLSAWRVFLQDGRLSRSKPVSNASGRRQTTRRWHPAYQAWMRGGSVNAANGGIMKCVPSLLAAPSRGVAAREAEEICFDTHPDPRCTLAAWFMMHMAWLMCDGVTPMDAYHRSMVSTYQRGKASGLYLPTLMEALLQAPRLAWKDWINGGYVVPALQVAVAAVIHASSFEDGLMAVIERGGDADTVGAIAGVLLGARFGLAGIPQRWRDQLRLRSYEGTGTELQRLSKLRLNFKKLGRIGQDRGYVCVGDIMPTETSPLDLDALRGITAEILGVAERLVPRAWIFYHPNAELARAVTIKNACVMLERANRGIKLDPLTPPWSYGYREHPRQMIAQLVCEGLMGPQIGD
jgi:ADP-ribosyl-[dinitrogen reductase] hydrolase